MALKRINKVASPSSRYLCPILKVTVQHKFLCWLCARWSRRRAEAVSARSVPRAGCKGLHLAPGLPRHWCQRCILRFSVSADSVLIPFSSRTYHGLMGGCVALLRQLQLGAQLAPLAAARRSSCWGARSCHGFW